jgi:SAM-dependent methyltransferase
MDERSAWNRRYADGDYTPRAEPARFLEDWIDRFPPGRALDVACGTGRNALRLAEAGFDVDAVDISEVAIARAGAEAERRGLKVSWHVVAMDEYDIPAGSYQLITVVRYRNSSLWPRLRAGLAPDGWILVEHHMKSTAEVLGPSTPDFRLDPQELLVAFGSLRVLHYSEQLEPGDLDPGHYALARLVACNGDPGF